MTETITAQFIDALYRALREDQLGTLKVTPVAVGALDIRRSSIVTRVEALVVGG